VSNNPEYVYVCRNIRSRNRENATAQIKLSDLSLQNEKKKEENIAKKIKTEISVSKMPMLFD